MLNTLNKHAPGVGDELAHETVPLRATRQAIPDRRPVLEKVQSFLANRATVDWSAVLGEIGGMDVPAGNYTASETASQPASQLSSRPNSQLSSRPSSRPTSQPASRPISPPTELPGPFVASSWLKEPSRLTSSRPAHFFTGYTSHQSDSQLANEPIRLPIGQQAPPIVSEMRRHKVTGHGLGATTRGSVGQAEVSVGFAPVDCAAEEGGVRTRYERIQKELYSESLRGGSPSGYNATGVCPNCEAAAQVSSAESSESTQQARVRLQAGAAHFACAPHRHGASKLELGTERSAPTGAAPSDADYCAAEVISAAAAAAPAAAVLPAPPSSHAVRCEGVGSSDPPSLLSDPPSPPTPSLATFEGRGAFPHPQSLAGCSAMLSGSEGHRLAVHDGQSPKVADGRVLQDTKSSVAKRVARGGAATPRGRAHRPIGSAGGLHRSGSAGGLRCSGSAGGLHRSGSHGSLARSSVCGQDSICSRSTAVTSHRAPPSPQSSVKSGLAAQSGGACSGGLCSHAAPPPSRAMSSRVPSCVSCPARRDSPNDYLGGDRDLGRGGCCSGQSSWVPRSHAPQRVISHGGGVVSAPVDYASQLAAIRTDMEVEGRAAEVLSKQLAGAGPRHAPLGAQGEQEVELPSPRLAYFDVLDRFEAYNRARRQVGREELAGTRQSRSMKQPWSPPSPPGVAPRTQLLAT